MATDYFLTFVSLTHDASKRFGDFKEGASICYCAYVQHCESWDCPRDSSFFWILTANTKVSARFMNTREKKILARSIGLRKENWR